MGRPELYKIPAQSTLPQPLPTKFTCGLWTVEAGFLAPKPSMGMCLSNG